MKALKAFIKPFEAPQRSVKKKKFNLICITLQLLEMHRTLRANRVCDFVVKNKNMTMRKVI